MLVISELAMKGLKKLTSILFLILFALKVTNGKLRMFLKQVHITTDPEIALVNITVDYVKQNLFDFNIQIFGELLVDIPSPYVNILLLILLWMNHKLLI